MIRAVLFDGDQTLWDFRARHARRAGRRPGRTAGGAARALHVVAALAGSRARDRAAVGVELEGVEYNLARLRVLGFARTLARLRAADGGDEAADAALAGELGASYFHHRDRDPALFPDTLPCLDALYAHYRLGLLSNGSRLPEKVGLGQYFESVVFAQDHLVAKPDKGIFEVVERQLGVGRRPACWWATIPSTTSSGPSARRLGRRVDRPRRRGCVRPARRCAEHPDAVVTSLDELPRALEGLWHG